MEYTITITTSGGLPEQLLERLAEIGEDREPFIALALTRDSAAGSIGAVFNVEASDPYAAANRAIPAFEQLLRDAGAPTDIEGTVAIATPEHDRRLHAFLNEHALMDRQA